MTGKMARKVSKVLASEQMNRKKVREERKGRYVGN